MTTASRRSFLAGLLAAGMAPQASWADTGNPAFLAAGKTADDRFLLAGLDTAGNILFRHPLPARGHALIQADCLEWLKRERGRYDLIFLAPPTFSNSKRMRETLDIQRDHGTLVRDSMGLLAPGGVTIFSTNYRRFEMDVALAEEFDVEDVGAKTLPKDFERRPRIHNTWKITRRPESARKG